MQLKIEWNLQQLTCSADILYVCVYEMLQARENFEFE